MVMLLLPKLTAIGAGSSAVRTTIAGPAWPGVFLSRHWNVKAKVTKIILLLSVVVLSGCSSTNPDKALKTISQWIPPGTPREDTIRIMKQHGYDSGPCGSPKRQMKEGTVFCFWHETKILKNSRWFFVRFKNGKVLSIEGWGTGNNFFDFLEHDIPSGE